MLNITGINNFYYIRNFHDMRCKYERVLSVIHQQFNQEPEDGDVFLMMSKNQRKVRLFNYEKRAFSLYEKTFIDGYRFMKLEIDGDEKIYKVDWKDVVLLLESPVVKTFKIK